MIGKINQALYVIITSASTHWHWHMSLLKKKNAASTTGLSRHYELDTQAFCLSFVSRKRYINTPQVFPQLFYDLVGFLGALQMTGSRGASLPAVLDFFPFVLLMVTPTRAVCSILERQELRGFESAHWGQITLREPVPCSAVSSLFFCGGAERALDEKGSIGGSFSLSLS